MKPDFRIQKSSFKTKKRGCATKTHIVEMEVKMLAESQVMVLRKGS